MAFDHISVWGGTKWCWHAAHAAAPHARGHKTPFRPVPPQVENFELPKARTVCALALVSRGCEQHWCARRPQARCPLCSFAPWPPVVTKLTVRPGRNALRDHSRSATCLSRAASLMTSSTSRRPSVLSRTQSRVRRLAARMPRLPARLPQRSLVVCPCLASGVVALVAHAPPNVRGCRAHPPPPLPCARARSSKRAQAQLANATWGLCRHPPCRRPVQARDVLAVPHQRSIHHGGHIRRHDVQPRG